MDEAIRVCGLSKSFGPVRALSDVNFGVPAGSLCGLVGPNGAGKTTLLSVAAGFLRPNEGSVTLLGLDTARDLPRLRGRFSMLVQDAALPPGRKILNTLTYLARLAGTPKKEARQDAERVLSLCGLSEHASKRFRQLSHGMTRRLHVAQAFLGSPDLIFLDEPTSGVDPENAAQLRRIISELAGRSTVVVSSHNLAELEETCSDLVILDKGTVAYCGSMEDFLSGGTLLRFQFHTAPGTEALAALDALAGVAECVPRGPMELHVTLEFEDAPARHVVLRSILECCLAHDLVPRSMAEGARLEERFLERIGSGLDPA